MNELLEDVDDEQVLRPWRMGCPNSLYYPSRLSFCFFLTEGVRLLKKYSLRFMM